MYQSTNKGMYHVSIIEYSCISITWFVSLLFLLLRDDSGPCMYVMTLNARTLFYLQSTSKIANLSSISSVTQAASVGAFPDQSVTQVRQEVS